MANGVSSQLTIIDRFVYAMVLVQVVIFTISLLYLIHHLIRLSYLPTEHIILISISNLVNLLPFIIPCLIKNKKTKKFVIVYAIVSVIIVITTIINIIFFLKHIHEEVRLFIYFIGNIIYSILIILTTIFLFTTYYDWNNNIGDHNNIQDMELRII